MSERTRAWTCPGFLAAWALFVACAAGGPAAPIKGNDTPVAPTSAGGPKVQFEPSSGKSAGPIGARVSYPIDHPKNVPVPIAVEVWSTDGDASALAIQVRLDPGLGWGAGERSVTFAGPIVQNEHRRHEFSVIPTVDGPAYVTVDVSRQREGESASRSFALLLKGGAKLEGDELPSRGSKKGVAP